MKVVQWILQVVYESRRLLLEFWNLLHIWRTVEVGNFKFGRQINHEGFLRKNEIKSERSWRGYVTYFWNFRTPSISRERLKLETSNLARRLDKRGSYEKLKIRSKEVVNRRVTYWLNTKGTNEKMENYVKEGHEEVTWPTFRILRLLLYLGNGWNWKFQFRHADWARQVL